MPPSLRSSAPNTPTARSTGGNDPSTLTPRKTPTCTKCKRPRAGHPRSGCPYVDSPSKDNNVSNATAGEKNLTDALGSMQLRSPTRERDEETKAFIRNRRRSSHQVAPTQTLLSLSSESQEIVERLLQPGMFDDDTDEDNNAGSSEGKTKTKVVQWQETLLAATPAKPKPRVKMPGSLSTPSPDSSHGSADLSANKKKKEASPALEVSTSAAVERDATPPPARHPQPLARSMSVEQRDLFISTLTQSSDATVYMVPAHDIHDIHAHASRIGFHARIVPKHDDRDSQALLVLGHNEAAVKRLFKKVEAQRKKSSPGFSAAAGGAVVGAVGAWAGLAFT
ncbi:hypothetical protein Hypma_012915 [Hypsizygus marmoreus]|uniref:Uncharacterized protein n=1 Tax=Hypsizygus marmoreus TaxID=39966 RepID=A0A369JFS6_HYPMA|nr:hypothetical protein Hypma_012915 [Hypsizygus marmoreus]